MLCGLDAGQMLKGEPVELRQQQRWSDFAKTSALFGVCRRSVLKICSVLKEYGAEFGAAGGT